MEQSILAKKILGCSALAYLKSGKLERAIDIFEQSIKIFDESKTVDLDNEKKRLINDFTEELKKEADKYFSVKDYGSALLCYRWLLDSQTSDKDVLRKCATCLESIGRYDLEIEVVKKSIELIKVKEHGYKQLGDAYRLSGDYKEAIKSYEKYLTIFRSDADVYNYIGWMYEQLYIVDGQTDYIKKSYENFKKGYNISPDNRTILSNLVISSGKARLKDECGIYWKRLLTMNPTHDEWYAYAAYCLNKGDFDTAFGLFHHRYKKETRGMEYLVKQGERWDGSQDITNSTLLIHYEQGYGDTFMFSRLLPQVSRLAKKVIFYSRKEMGQILRESDLGVEIYDSSQPLESIKYDYQVLLMDLPHILKLKKDEIPLTEGYLKASESLIKKYKKEYFDNNKYKIGIMYEGSENGMKSRNMPIDRFKQIAGLDNVLLYSLQIGKPDSYFAELPFKVINIGKHFKTFADTAAALMNCDLLITTDNCVLNLSGALGHKTIAVFNSEPECRWFDLSGEDVGWYKSVKPYCLSEQDKWDEIIPEIIEDVESLIQNQSEDKVKISDNKNRVKNKLIDKKNVKIKNGKKIQRVKTSAKK